MDDLEENKDNMNLDESAFFSMGSLLGQGTDNQPKAISGFIIFGLLSSSQSPPSSVATFSPSLPFSSPSLCTLGKIVAAVWWMTGTIFVATYTANLAAFLTITKSAINIRTLEDLVHQDEFKYGTVLSSQPAQFFERSDLPLYQKMWGHMTSSNTLMVGWVARVFVVFHGS